MLDVWSATKVAWLGDGYVIHDDCLDADIRKAIGHRLNETHDEWFGIVAEYNQFDRIAEDEFNLTPLIRYNIHEWESSNLSEAIHQGDLDVDDDGEDSPLVWVICDECGNRIE